MISKPDMGLILQPLEKRFKNLSGDQAEVYHDRLKMYDRAILKEAVEDLIDNAKGFPTPGEIKMAVRTAYAKRVKDGNPIIQVRACPQCQDGYVHYEKLVGDKYRHFVGDCAFCHRGEITIQPQVVQLEDRIYFACERFMDAGVTRYRANPDVQDPYPEAMPIKTNVELKQYFDSPRMARSIPVKELVPDMLDDVPF